MLPSGPLEPSHLGRWLVAFATLMLPVWVQSVLAQVPPLHWAKQVAEETLDIGCWDIVTDPGGYVYAVGGYGGPADFDPGPGTYILPCLGGTDGYIQKLDTSGNFIWARAFSGASITETESIALDAAGNVVVSGFFAGTVDFDPGVGVFSLTASSTYDLFVVKLSPAGNLIWADRMGGGAADQLFSAKMAVDPFGNVLVTGGFTGTVDFDPGPGMSTLVSGGTGDAFVLKLTTMGSLAWVRRMGAAGDEQGATVVSDAAGNVYTGGFFTSAALDADPGAGTFNLIRGGSMDYFVQKLDPTGSFMMAYSIQGSTSSTVNGHTFLDPAGNIITCGWFNGTVDLDPSAGNLNFTTNTLAHAFVQKVSPGGGLLWARHFVSDDVINFWGCAGDGDGSIYVAGSYGGNADADPGPGVAALSPPSTYDGLLIKLDASGNYAWHGRLQGNADTYSDNIAVDMNRNVYAGGQYYGTTDFDPQGSTFLMSSDPSAYAMFVLKLRVGNSVLQAGELKLAAETSDLGVRLSWRTLALGSGGRCELLRGESSNEAPVIATIPFDGELDQGYYDKDVQTGHTYFYQLRQMDAHGNVARSSVTEVHLPILALREELTVFPDPVIDHAWVEYWGGGWRRVELLDAAGGSRFQSPADIPAGRMEMDFSNLPAGMYLVRVTLENGGTLVKRVLKIDQ